MVGSYNGVDKGLFGSPRLLREGHMYDVYFWVSHININHEMLGKVYFEMNEEL
jgi:hypothetical protein